MKRFGLNIITFFILTISMSKVFAIDLIVELEVQTSEKQLKQDLTDKILNDISIYKISQLKQLKPERIELLHKNASDEIEEILIANGYNHAKIKSNLTRKKETYYASYHINPGKPTLINKISITISDQNYPKDLNKLLKISDLKKGEIFTHSKYEDAKEDLLAEFIDLGYLNSYFSKHEVLVDLDKYTADIELILTLDRRYKLGKVDFESKIYKDYILQRYVPFEESDPYASTKLEELQKNLLNTGFFEKIRIYPKPDLENPKNNIVPIDVKLEEKPYNRYNGSVGYGTNTSFRASLGFLRRHIGDTGQQFGAQIFASKVIKAIKTNYNIPGNNPLKNTYSIHANAIDERVEDRLSKKIEGIGEKIINKNNIQRKFGLKFTQEVFIEKSGANKENSHFLLPFFKYSWIKEDEESELLQGKRIDFLTQISPGKLLSSTKYLELEVDAKWIAKLTSNARLLLRGNIGGIFTENFDRVPVSMRYFTGGDNSIRGFAYKSLGPTETDNNGKIVVVGGKYKLVTSAEIDYMFKPGLSVATFIDAGNAMDKFNEALAIGAGAGFRYHSPLGTLRFDLAKPLANRSNKNNLRIHLTFGKEL